jgi:hypothetical protein
VSGYVGMLWLRGGRVTLGASMSSRVAMLGRRLGLDAAVRVFGSPRACEAVAVGFWRPIVLVPLSWLTELPPDVLEAVVAHELAHIRRYDLWVNLFQRVLETVLFYHPAVWWVSRQITLEREMCCDELAVAVTGRRAAYAQALETIGRRTAGVSLVLATSFHGEPEMNLLKRVRCVLGLRPQRESGVAWPAGLLALGLAIGVWSLSMGLAGQASRADAQEERAGEKQAVKERSAEAEAGARRSAEGEAGARRSAEGEAGTRRSAEAEAGARRSAEAESRPRRPAEADAPTRRRDEAAGRERPAAEGPARSQFRPQTDREAALFEMVQQLQREVAQLRREVAQMRGMRDGDPLRRPTARDSDLFRPRDGEDNVRRGPRDGEGPARPGPRDGEGGARNAPRDGEAPANRGPRDGEGPPKKGPRDGEGPARPGPRDAEAPKARDQAP